MSIFHIHEMSARMREPPHSLSTHFECRCGLCCDTLAEAVRLSGTGPGLVTGIVALALAGVVVVLMGAVAVAVR